VGEKRSVDAASEETVHENVFEFPTSGFSSEAGQSPETKYSGL
jgi:hypothetical protein